MTYKRKMSSRILSVFVCITLLISMLPLTISGFAATANPQMVSDPSTLDQWKQFFPIDTNGDFNTTNAGGVWSDKSVFTSNTTIDGKPFNIDGDNNFLVALSAIGSNMTVTGKSQVPTDVMFVLDVSGSMNESNNNAAESLVNATNASIKSLLANNENSRVGVVLYSGPSSFGNGSLNNASVILPLASYKTEDTQDRYLTYTKTTSYYYGTTETVSVADGVYTEVATVGGVNKQYARSSSKNVVGGTYIQAGLALAEDQFLAADTTVTPEGMGTVTRIPVIVLMSDGATSLATDSFQNPGTSDMGDGGETKTTYDMGFVTQLTAANTKNNVSKYYGTDCLFYTLGMLDPNYTVSSTTLSPAQITAQTTLVKNVVSGVLDPKNSCTQLVNRWNAYKATQAGRNYSLSDHNNKSVYRVSDADLANMPMNYVTGYFDANDYKTPTSGSLADALAGAFEAIVAEIALQAVYHPTLVEGGTADHSGYISFVDKIGSYMKVNNVKGIMSGGTLFTGEKLAESFHNNLLGTGGSLGAMPNQGESGYVFLTSVATRLSISNEQAWALLSNAWTDGQIAYDSDTKAFSNWFGWVSNSTGNYIQPWNENANGTDYHILPQNAAYINRSYIFLGADGDTDMMYATVRVREKVVNGVPTGEQEINFNIPASLLPIITYKVKVDENGNATNIDIDSDTPIHLIYELGLDPEINKFNVKDKVSPEYLEANTVNGDVVFYTNAWEHDKTTGYGKANTYSYFRPSSQNDRYYYQHDSFVYTNTNGTKYTGTVHPSETSGTYYYLYSYYAKVGSSFKTVNEYHDIPGAVLSVAKANADTTWTIKAGTVRSDYSGQANMYYKDDPDTATLNDGNKSGTLAISHEPFTDTNSYSFDDTSHRSVVGVTLANNGRFALTPETGIRLSKSLATDVTLPSGQNPDFTFEIEYAGQNTDLEAYAYRMVDGQISARPETVEFRSGKATVTLKAGETLYIGGMTTGEVTVTETTTLEYVVQTVTVDTVPQVGNSASVTLAEGDMKDIDFVNTTRGTGILNVAKSVTYPDGVSADAINSKTFTVNVTLMFNGQPLTDYTVYNAAGQPFAKTSDAGVIPVTLSNGKQVTLYNIPEGVEATVQENTASLPNGFSPTPVYWENGERKDGKTEANVTISTDSIADVMVRNTYNPAEVTTSFNITLNKDFFQILNGDREYVSNAGKQYSFSFTLQRRDIDTGAWIDVGGKITFDYDESSHAIRKTSHEFAERLQDISYSKAGIYRYRILETLGNEEHIIYDNGAHSFGVEVADNDADGSWEIYQARTSTPDNVVIAQNPEGTAYGVTVTFENEYKDTVGTTAVIEINKTVDDPAGVIYNANGKELAEGFEFRVYEQDGITPVEGVEVQATNTGGVTRFTLTYANDVLATSTGVFNYVIKELGTAPAGWTYDGEQYVTVKVSSDGAGSLSAVAYLNNPSFTGSPATTDTDNSVTVPFVNRYDPADAEVQLNFVKKQLNGREFNGDNFTFKLEGVNGSVVYAKDGIVDSNNAILGNATATSGNTAAVAFDNNLFFNKVGTYYYAITETSTAANGVSVDSTVYRITVTVSDNGAGQLNAAYVVTSVVGNQITFVNTYTAQPATLNIEGTKTLTGRNITENDFQFVLTNTDVTPNAVHYTVNADYGNGDSTFKFPTLTFTQAGTYNYKVSEYNPTTAVAGYFDGITYDNTVYDVVVTVTDNKLGNLVATYTVDGSDTKKIAFNNKYEPAAINVPIEGIKDIIGRGITDNDKFTFNIYDVDYVEATDTWNKKSETPKESINNVRNAITFTPITIKSAGTYRYLISEKTEAAGGITYDNTTWKVTVTVTDDGNGKLTPTVRYQDNTGIHNEMIFRNIYDIKDGFIEISGKKTLENKTLNNNEFTFNVYETTNDFVLAENATALTSAKNDASGNFKLRLDYTKADIGETFYYVILEENAGKTIKGVTYSDNKYHLTVTVADNIDGTLKITKTLVLGEQNVETVEFKNTYKDTATVDVNITKRVDNKGSESITPEGFEFLLEKVGTNETVKVKTDATGKVKIPLNFTESDNGKIYSYKLTEIAGNRANVTYSNSEYNFTVAISVNGENELIATVTLNEKAVNTVEAEFVNIYDYTPPKMPSAPQTGDTSNISLWFALLFVSGGGLIGSMVFRKKKEAEKK